MTLTTFNLFSSLPPELRREIYMLATPPRIVHVQECTEEDYEDFEEEFRTTPVQLKLDPALAYFAFNWRQHIPSRSRQSTLESFGFSGDKPPHRPWDPSTSTPEIPLNWLSEHPKIAWQLTRGGFLYSNAPIPALLHTCSESRAELMNRGYQLAFRTRSSGPRTWFNFDRDILFLEFDRDYFEDYRSLLSGSPWDVGQFDPGDMQRVRKLMLERSANCLRPHKPRIGDDGHDHEVSAVLRLFGGLQELLLVEWTGQDIEGWPEFSPGTWVESKNRRRDPNAVDTARELWSCIAVEEIDALLSLFPPESSWRGTVFSTGEKGELLKAYKQKNGRSARFFRDMQLGLERRLTNHRDSVVAANRDRSITPWEIPKITAVHVLPRSKLKFLSQERLRAVEELGKLKTKWASVARSKAASASVSSEWHDEEEAFAEAHWPEPPAPCCGQCAEGYYELRLTNEQKKWWIQEGPIPALRDHYIY